MRIIRFIATDGRTLHGEQHSNGDVTVLTGSITDGFQRTSQRIKVKKLLAPLEPTDIICIGRNYSPLNKDTGSDEKGRRRNEEGPGHARLAHNDHTLEVFLKPSTAFQNPSDPILIPQFDGIDPQLDCEGELALVIGREARNVSDADALQFVFGYTIANDVTARHFQTASGPPLWMRGKSFDTFCPLGPAIVTADDIPNPNHLGIRTLINQTIVREGNTSQMIRTVPQVIAALSRHMTLRVGAVVLTGAPPAASNQTLKPSDRVTIEVESVGHLTNPIA